MPSTANFSLSNVVNIIVAMSKRAVRSPTLLCHDDAPLGMYALPQENFRARRVDFIERRAALRWKVVAAHACHGSSLPCVNREQLAMPPSASMQLPNRETMLNDSVRIGHVG